MTDRAPWQAGRRWRLVAFAALVLGGVLLARHLGAGELLSGDGVGRVRRWVEGWGALGPVAFIAGYVLGVISFVPGLAMTVLAGVVFGPLWGTLYASLGSTLGACLAFVIARYAARDLVTRWVLTSPALTRLDRATARHGFRLVMVTRLVPIFPFNLQNYAYGVTGIGFVAYALTSWLCMLPATVGLTIAGGALSGGGWDPWRTRPWLALAAAVLILLSLLPRWLRGKSRMLDDLVRPGRGC